MDNESLVLPGFFLMPSFWQPSLKPRPHSSAIGHCAAQQKPIMDYMLLMRHFAVSATAWSETVYVTDRPWSQRCSSLFGDRKETKDVLLH